MSNQNASPEPRDDQQAPAAPVRTPEPRWVTPVLLAGIAVFLYLVRSILTPFVIAAILAYVISPVIVWAEEKVRLPRPATVVALLVLLLVPIGAIVWIVEPALVRETNSLVQDAPALITKLMVEIFGSERIDVLGQTVDARSISLYLERGLADTIGQPRGAIHAAAIAGEIILQTFLSLVLLVYFLINPRPFGEMALRLVPSERRPELRGLAAEIHGVLGRYVRGLAFLVALMAAVTWTGLALFFHLPYSLPIAITTGFLEIIPFLGPVAAGTIAAAVALATGGPQMALWIAVFYLVIRQLEDQLVMPLVIGHAVELHPAVNIFAVLAGSALWGVLGALLAIPVAATIKVIFLHFRPD